MNEDRDNTQEITERSPMENCSDCVSDTEMTPLEKWIQKSPQTRQPEVDYLINAGLGSQLQITDSGDLQQAFKIDKWVFLMVISKTFPKETETGDIPVKVCLVVPNAEEIQKMIGNKKVPSVVQDNTGIECLDFEIFGDEYGRYLNGQHNKLLTETLLLHTREWVGLMLSAIEKERSKRASRESGLRIPSFLNWGRSKDSADEYYEPTESRRKYVDGRKSVTHRVNPRCKKIVLSDRAYIQIFNESQSRIETETGGLLLGHFDNGVWYVVEASDPGINAKFYNAYHEGDDVYENHVCGVISRTYKYPLVFLGMWHRHPGSLDSFSGTDDGTNYKYAGSAGNGCISAIINYDPNFRITFYYAEQGEYRRVYYTKVDVEVGDDKIPNKDMLKVASIDDVLRRRER